MKEVLLSAEVSFISGGYLDHLLLLTRVFACKKAAFKRGSWQETISMFLCIDATPLVYMMLVLTKNLTGKDKESFESCNARTRYITYRHLSKKIRNDVTGDIDDLKLASWSLVHYLNRGIL